MQKEERCPTCNKLLMKSGEIKCPRCKEIVHIGMPCQFYTECSHRKELERLSTIKKMIKTLPVAMKERMRLSNYQ